MGDSSDQMNDEGHANKKSNETIREGPTAPELQRDGNSQWMEWKIVVSSTPKQSELDQLAAAVGRTGMEVAYSIGKQFEIQLNVRQTPAADYTELYDACLNAIVELEKYTGSLQAIQGLPRSRWERQFIFARRFGALE